MPAHSSTVSPLYGDVAWRKSPEKGSQDGQGYCGPEGEARAISQETSGWGLSLMLGVAGVRAAPLPLTNPNPAS